MPDHSYVTIRSRLSASVQDILGSVTEKLQYSEEPAGREDSLILVAVASSGGEAQKELGWVVGSGGGRRGETHKPWGRSKQEFWALAPQSVVLGPATLSITWELIKTAIPQTLLQTCPFRVSILTKFPGDSCAY